MSYQHRSIGIFDSGFGGLTVMKAIRTLLPYENIIYFGDTARLPYGTKSRETVLAYSRENAAFLVTQGIKALVVACHTACSFALDELQKEFDLPVVGVTIPTIDGVALESTIRKIAILGTRGTISSGTYQNALLKKLPNSEIVSIPCQLLVHLVEEGYIDHPITRLTLSEYLAPLKTQNIDTLILACTHFPLLKDEIQKFLNPRVNIVDPAYFCACALEKILKKNHLLNPEEIKPVYQFVVSDDPEKFRLLGKSFLGQPLDEVKLIGENKKKSEFFLYT